MQTDPIADFLTSIRNANQAKKVDVTVPSSKIKIEIARVLKAEGYIADYSSVEDDKQGRLTVTLRYSASRERILQHIERVSKPGRRIYVGKTEIPRVLGGLGVAILSTPRGVLTGSNAKSQGVGGELLAKVY
ncbi:SSU ribosomal protein S8P [Abditibacterium utsteinense]|uniref:Small ribosomal subunit protein uS8 n=1 Tax=Abditibacterium utsteinense TaxID=1960156 RepID=A0A2S8ST57_9BACT|nr:30S ribosomal protein S8 [Abditibacterium utsteinense]PQV63958.1 SSU ribosomal protein S8P [Abditibacterium utsteinense]